jgi:quercetin dioxygenase-like cupin family protein
MGESRRKLEQGSSLVPLGNVPSLAMIQAFEGELRKLPQLEAQTTHHFAEGLYGRELFIPAGAVLTGKIHKGQHLNFLMQGDITVWTEQGMKRLQAPAVIVSEPGTKRVGYAHADTIWVTVHASHETDLDKLEEELIVPETAAITTEDDALCLGQQ